MHVAVNSHALPVYKKNRIGSLLCIFETLIIENRFSYSNWVLKRPASMPVALAQKRLNGLDTSGNQRSQQKKNPVKLQVHV